MYRTTLVFAVAFLLFAMLVAGGNGTPSKGILTQTPTPTAEPVFDYPGIDSLLPGKRLSEALQLLGTLGVQEIIDGSNYVQLPADVQSFGIVFQDLVDIKGQYTGVRISASVTSQSDVIQETAIDVDNRLRILPDDAWQLINPSRLVNSFGTPTIARAGVGNGGTLLLIWEHKHAAVWFNFLFGEEDIPKMGLMPERFTLCLKQDRGLGATMWLTMSQIDIREFIVRDSNHTPLAYGQPFSPTMFTNAPDLATMAQRLANGECLETRREVWFGSQ